MEELATSLGNVRGWRWLLRGKLRVWLELSFKHICKMYTYLLLRTRGVTAGNWV